MRTDALVSRNVNNDVSSGIYSGLPNGIIGYAGPDKEISPVLPAAG